jgi:hypothetical protein
VRKLKNKYISLAKSRIRYLGVKMDRKYLQDLLHHAQDFWKIYKGRKKQYTIQEVEMFVFHFQRLYSAANAANLPQSSPCGAPGDEGDIYLDLGGIKGPQSSHPVHSESIFMSDLITLPNYPILWGPEDEVYHDNAHVYTMPEPSRVQVNRLFD